MVLPADCDVLFSGQKTHGLTGWFISAQPVLEVRAGHVATCREWLRHVRPDAGGHAVDRSGHDLRLGSSTVSSTTFLTTQLRHVDDATQQAALTRLKELGWTCSSEYGGQWCLTNDSHTGVSIGESQFLGKSVWLASDWNNAGPENYTPRLLTILFG